MSKIYRYNLHHHLNDSLFFEHCSVEFRLEEQAHIYRYYNEHRELIAKVTCGEKSVIDIYCDTKK